MNLLNDNQANQDNAYVWLANALILVVVVLLGTMAVAKYLSLV